MSNYKITIRDDSDISRSGGSAGISLGTLGFITWLVFFILKLTCASFSAAVSWFWVWFPLWICPAIGLGIMLICCIIIGIVSLIDR